MRPLEARDPARIAHYRLMCVLGTGGMGRVYLAQGPDGGYVALKVAHPALAAVPVYRVRFAREVAALMRVDGLCTAQVHDFDVDGPTLWVAMDYVPGPTLGGLVRRTGPLSPGTSRLLAIGLAEALESIHAAGLIHRDLKPGNVIMSSAGPRVVDFGVARAVDSTPLTHSGQVMGTVGWMAPEQLDGAEESPATDMFAWGAVVHYAVTGRHPFGGGRAETVALRVRHEDPDLRGLGALDPALRAFVARALDRQAAARPAPGSVIRTLLGIPRGATPEVIDDALTRTFAAWPAGAAERGAAAQAVRAGGGGGGGAQGASLDARRGLPIDQPPGTARGPLRTRRRASGLLAAVVVLLGAGSAAASIAAHPVQRGGAGATDAPVASGAADELVADSASGSTGSDAGTPASDATTSDATTSDPSTTDPSTTDPSTTDPARRIPARRIPARRITSPPPTRTPPTPPWGAGPPPPPPSPRRGPPTTTTDPPSTTSASPGASRSAARPCSGAAQRPVATPSRARRSAACRRGFAH